MGCCLNWFGWTDVGQCVATSSMSTTSSISTTLVIVPFLVRRKITLITSLPNNEIGCVRVLIYMMSFCIFRSLYHSKSILLFIFSLFLILSYLLLNFTLFKLDSSNSFSQFAYIFWIMKVLQLNSSQDLVHQLFRVVNLLNRPELLFISYIKTLFLVVTT